MFLSPKQGDQLQANLEPKFRLLHPKECLIPKWFFKPITRPDFAPSFLRTTRRFLQQRPDPTSESEVRVPALGFFGVRRNFWVNNIILNVDFKHWQLRLRSGNENLKFHNFVIKKPFSHFRIHPQLFELGLIAAIGSFRSQIGRNTHNDCVPILSRYLIF